MKPTAAARWRAVAQQVAEDRIFAPVFVLLPVRDENGHALHARACCDDAAHGTSTAEKAEV